MATVKKGNHYKLSLEQLSVLKEEKRDDNTLELEFSNHDELFEIIEKVKSKQLFNSEEEPEGKEGEQSAETRNRVSAF